MTDTIASILEAHRTGAATPAQTIARTYARIRAHGDPAIFISLRDETEVIAEAEKLAGNVTLPLYGVPFAVKDNIDVAGLGTTAACPAFAYRAARDATSVARLRQAGAIVIGKTNLDQFATGLVGVRSPYGVPRNALRADLIPGGSSSGSAVAVGAGLVPFALGTDTAGSGRVPAMLNNIVGLKPSLGLVPTSGVVPACRTLDCVSVFALSVDDAFSALRVMAGLDPTDPFSRPLGLSHLGNCPQHLRIGVPQSGQRIFFNDRAASAGYERALSGLVELGATLIEIDCEPLFEAARLLYEGPWVAERYLTVKDLLASSPDALHPVTRQIVVDGARPTAADAFRAFYRLEELRRVAEQLLAPLDALAVPTAPTTYTVEDVLKDPILLNSRLGTYTNFVNLLDLCGLALPATLGDDRTPFGITLLAPAGRDAALASIGRVFHQRRGLPVGASSAQLPPLAPVPRLPAAGEIAVAVVGAHLSGMPLNGELRALGARLIDATMTAADYKLYALAGTTPPKPGLVRVAPGEGTPIAVEIWALSTEGFGQFVAKIPSPMAIGTLRLADGRTLKGFLVEPEAIAGARDISHYGGWRSYMASALAPA